MFSKRLFLNFIILFFNLQLNSSEVKYYRPSRWYYLYVRKLPIEEQLLLKKYFLYKSMVDNERSVHSIWLNSFEKIKRNSNLNYALRKAIEFEQGYNNFYRSKSFNIQKKYWKKLSDQIEKKLNAIKEKLVFTFKFHELEKTEDAISQNITKLLNTLSQQEKKLFFEFINYFYDTMFEIQDISNLDIDLNFSKLMEVFGLKSEPVKRVFLDIYKIIESNNIGIRDFLKKYKLIQNS